MNVFSILSSGSRRVVLLAAAFGFARVLSAAEPGAKLDSHTGAFLKEHCLRCHGPEEVKGDLRLDQLDTDFSKPSTFERKARVRSACFTFSDGLLSSGLLPGENRPTQI
ncbi:MAG: hypothetical protein FD161_4033 [Limisphaerales bacterium]|nr:MAG: hypothetical protein FD161_4033 [Limisphaerales bacterium]KAG0507242.1 MAG: hypothetical protein E1N63_3585 [Limisphaerales bacterium]TXT47832.1 MAG: hypothetical protein FD140_4022 [Limisphaerales bacterium]